MSNSRVVICIDTNLPVGTLNNVLTDANKRTYGQKVINFVRGLVGGARSASVKSGAVSLSADAVAASLAGTFTGAPTADDTVTVNGVAFTAKASGATGNQFNIGGTVTVTAANLAAAINASASDAVSGVVSAASLAGVITITCLIPGVIGNSVTVAESCANFTFAGAATALASGTGKLPVLTTYSFGK